jgi:YVTN family beta-propeller protein
MPRQPVGTTPSSLSLSPDKRRLYIACSDANAVAVIDVAGAASKVMGFVPTGWYPTAVRALHNGRLVVLNGKGLGSHPNPDGPNQAQRPARDRARVRRRHSGRFRFCNPQLRRAGTTGLH